MKQLKFHPVRGLKLRVFSPSLRRSALACVLMALPASAFQSDLRVLSLDDSGVVGNWQSLAISGALQSIIENPTAIPVVGNFDVVAYSDENANQVYDTGVDTLLGTISVAGLAAATQQGISVPLSGVVHFRRDKIFLLLDSNDVVAESDEGNNQLATGSDCAVSIPPGSINPVLQWSWNSSAVEPLSLNVLMTPVVIDVNGDLVPDVVFGSTDSTGGGYVEVGILRALDGASGAELWTVTNPALAINVAYSIAAGDIDNDGLVEIIACDANNTQLICFENDGTFKWRSPLLEGQDWGAAAIADLDHDGSPEIISGRQVLDSNGNLLWTGTAGSSTTGNGPLALVCDIDLDGSPDVVGGNTVYRADGTILCQNTLLPDGYCAVANFDADAQPEIVLVSNGEIFLVEQDPAAPSMLRTIWGPLAISFGGAGGPPTVADYDGDGLPEIGVAGNVMYSVYEHDGSLKWEAPIQDTSQITGSSVFDFNGDGIAEVVYRDELQFHIFDGPTGAVLFEIPLSSCTWHEYPLVADVDADGNAEIVIGANNNCGLGIQQGIFVYRDLNDAWVPTRRVWNQHTYHITNVDESGAIPAYEQESWLYPAGTPFNSYRQNTLSTTFGNATPDLTASRLVAIPVGTPDSVSARIGNGGASFVGAGIPVAFYDGDPLGSGVLLGVAFTSIPLAPGAFEDVALFVGTVPPLVYVQADDAGAGLGIEIECDETNNSHSAALIPPASTVYCTAKLTSNGCTPAIASTGLPSATAGSGFFVTGTNFINNKNCILFYGISGRTATAYQGGTLCVKTPIKRTPSINTLGNPPPNDCSGVPVLDMNLFAAGGLGGTPLPALSVPGTVVNCQWWGRDPGFTAPTNTQLSNGLEYTIGS